MRTGILQNMADILDSVRLTPGPDLPGKTLPDQPRHLVHIAIAVLFCMFSRFIPQAHQRLRPSTSPALPQGLCQFFTPWQPHIGFSQLFLESITRDIPEFRFIRKETGDGLPEFCRIMGIMGLIDRI